MLMEDRRPNAEELLARVQEEEERAQRGKLKIFLGMAAGVGKTYKMLESARELLKEGVDVVAGCVVTHGRKETEALLQGLDILPPTTVEYKGAKLEEFDLDGALKRAPAVILVDELAHTNAPNCRHQKRWQDVEELLDSGIHVYTTLNIQHLESTNDIVAQITRVQVRETVPDSIFEKAYEIELVDLPPDELIQRLKDGKVYVSDKSQFALENFFRKGNLIALRELALRSTAERVDKQMVQYRADESIQTVWPASDRILVCVGPSPLSARVVRAARRVASRMDAEWMVAYVETPAYVQMPKKERGRLMRTLRLAEQLGAQTTVLTGTNVTEELVAYARRRNVSRIIIGKPARPRWKEILFGSVVDSLIRHSGDIEIDVISGDGEPWQSDEREAPKQSWHAADYGRALLVVVLATLVCQVLHTQLALVNLVMVYQLAVVWISVRSGRGPSVLAAILSVLACDFFFIPPYLSFAVSDTQYLVTLIVMLVVALTLSTLTHNLKHQAEMARLRERRTAALYAMAKEQAVAARLQDVIAISAKHVKEVFDSSVAICLGDPEGNLTLVDGIDSSFKVDNHEMGVAQWVYNNGQLAGAGTSTLPGAQAIYSPVRGSSGILGVIGVRAADSTKFLNPEELHLLEIFVNQIGLAIERASLTAQGHKGNGQNQTKAPSAPAAEPVKSSLLPAKFDPAANADASLKTTSDVDDAEVSGNDFIENSQSTAKSEKPSQESETRAVNQADRS